MTLNCCGEDVKPLVEFRLPSDEFYPATLPKCYKFSFGVDRFLSLDIVKKNKTKHDKLYSSVSDSVARYNFISFCLRFSTSGKIMTSRCGSCFLLLWMGVFILHPNSCITYHHLRFMLKQRKQEGRRDVGTKGSKRTSEKCISSSQDFI